jgi:hypothetical protein
MDAIEAIHGSHVRCGQTLNCYLLLKGASSPAAFYGPDLLRNALESFLKFADELPLEDDHYTPLLPGAEEYFIRASDGVVRCGELKAASAHHCLDAVVPTLILFGRVSLDTLIERSGSTIQFHFANSVEFDEVELLALCRVEYVKARHLALSELAGREKTVDPLDPVLEAAGKWANREAQKRTAWGSIRRGLAAHDGWPKYGDDNGAKAFVKRYRKQHDLPPLAPRNHGRPKR